MYFALLKFFKYGNFDALPQLGNNHNLDPKSILEMKTNYNPFNFSNCFLKVFFLRKVLNGKHLQCFSTKLALYSSVSICTFFMNREVENHVKYHTLLYKKCSIE
jgi:hypothetical protein